MRALESEIWWTFPAIKKQISSLEESEIIHIDKNNNKRSIVLNKDVEDVIKGVFLFWLQKAISDVLKQHEFIIEKYYFWRVFWYDIETDIVVIYKNCEKELLNVVKSEISEVFHRYHVENTYITFFSLGERQKRYQLADRFVLSILRIHS